MHPSSARGGRVFFVLCAISEKQKQALNWLPVYLISSVQTKVKVFF
jgi:hypothetical protein